MCLGMGFTRKRTIEKKTLMRKSRVKGPEREERKRQKWGKEEEKKRQMGQGGKAMEAGRSWRPITKLQQSPPPVRFLPSRCTPWSAGFPTPPSLLQIVIGH